VHLSGTDDARPIREENYGPCCVALVGLARAIIAICGNGSAVILVGALRRKEERKEGIRVDPLAGQDISEIAIITGGTDHKSRSTVVGRRDGLPTDAYRYYTQALCRGRRGGTSEEGKRREEDSTMDMSEDCWDHVGLLQEVSAAEPPPPLPASDFLIHHQEVRALFFHLL
ncbi:hypothetical protein ALC53_10399, partial [Atta colombica]